jgi:hypothetical protein
MFAKPIDSQIVTLRPHHTKKEEIRSLGLPSKIKVRFVRVLLDTGEVEILVTSILDRTFTIADFKELYHLRWGVETFYGIVKGRLDLENFTGKSVEVILQDFYSTIFLSSLESVLTEEAQTQLERKIPNNIHPQKVNKNVSFNAIKNHALDLFYKEQDLEVLIEKLTRLFTATPVCVRDNRHVPRKKTRTRALVSFLKRRRKICF